MKQYRIPVAVEGWVFILPLAVATAMLFAINWVWVGFVTLIFTLFVLFFFRDPDRTVPEGRGNVVAPADGRVVVIKDTFEPDYLKQEVKQISIFLSIFNVHVNRSPIKGTVELVQYKPGKFHIAFFDKASYDNEQSAMVIANRKQKILVKQIAGFVARRIVCYPRPGDAIKRGERYGLIRFGSRVDVFLPMNTKIMVNLGDRVKGSQDIIGMMQ